MSGNNESPIYGKKKRNKTNKRELKANDALEM